MSQQLQITENQQKAYKLIEEDRYSLKEAASILKITLSAMKNRLYRARQNKRHQKKCRMCGKFYNNRRTRYCSDICRQNRRKKKITQINCKICKEKVLTARSSQYLCLKEVCRKKYYREYNRKYRRQRYQISKKVRQEHRQRVKIGKLAKRDNLYKQLLLRDGNICSWCNRRLPLKYNGKQTHFDHVVPKSKNGSDSLENLQILHANCNLSKCDKIVQKLP